MLVEINLLPQKERRKKSFIITLIRNAALLLLLAAFIFGKSSYENNMANSIGKFQ